MSIYFFLFFLLSLSTAQDDCSTPKTCSDYGPPIHFPFRLKNHHPQHCGYHSFDLSCSPNNNATVLNLPNSVKVLVTHIDYKSRLIQIKDPNSCFPQQLQNLHLSATPFQFEKTFNFSLFSCPSTKLGFSFSVTCFSGDGPEVYAEYGEGLIYYHDPPLMLSCRKMYDLSVPIEAFQQADLQLKWHHRVEGKFFGYPLSLLSHLFHLQARTRGS
ncbi:RING-H2 finger protein ATL22-like [Rhododendron vialii]|uniref:RING-H2 finger protein ATL22-like n=1 Tax=Rhododendron vialii TaxID=182163 RepID=UPI00265F71B8|nr:RING-H2 finger protein ATL22-like [Rhododendron vialii]